MRERDDAFLDILETLVALRLERGIPRTVMATELRVRPEWLAQFEAGVVPIRLMALVRYGIRLGITLNIRFEPLDPPITLERSAATVGWSESGAGGGLVRRPTGRARRTRVTG